MKATYHRYKSVFDLLAAAAFFLWFLHDWLNASETANWLIFASLILSFLLSLRAVFTGAKLMRKKERKGLLLVYDLMAIVIGSAILIADCFFIIYIILTHIDQIQQN